MSLWKGCSRFCLYANNLSNIKQSLIKNVKIGLAARSLEQFRIHENGIHTTCTRQDLMEFFDDEKNWPEMEVPVGRSWKLEELRIKSNSDLHKLWYVLLKERNMLMTMQHEYERRRNSFPNPERLDKVEESMENLETVVRERNRAYFELETGDTGERPVGFDTNCFGLPYKYKKREHYIEEKYNTKFLAERKLHNYTNDHSHVKSFLTRLEEKKANKAKWQLKKQMAIACKMLKTFPHLDEEALQKNFPNINIEDVKKDKRSRGHCENKY